MNIVNPLIIIIIKVSNALNCSPDHVGVCLL